MKGVASSIHSDREILFFLSNHSMLTNRSRSSGGGTTSDFSSRDDVLRVNKDQQMTAKQHLDNLSSYQRQVFKEEDVRPNLVSPIALLFNGICIVLYCIM